MYRQYENPHDLERQLEELKKKFARPGYEMDEYDHEALCELQDRIRFAWDDDEYAETCAVYGW